MKHNNTAKFHLPGLFEFYEFYYSFLPIFFEHKEYFYDWVEIASIYGAPSDCIWSGGRLGEGDNNPEEVLRLLNKYKISGRLTFSNSLLQDQHLEDKKCNKLCSLFNENRDVQNGVIVHSDLLVNHILKKYPNLYLVSSTTKVLTETEALQKEIEKEYFRYVVPDFRLNKNWEYFKSLSQPQKDKMEFLCNECCFVGCKDRKVCYETVSRNVLDENTSEHICKAPASDEGYKFSKAMRSPMFIGVDDIVNKYLPLGFGNFKIEGRELGSALLLEFILYYMVKPEYHLQIREMLYLESTLNLF